MKRFLVHDDWLAGKKSNGFTLSADAIVQVKAWFKEKQPVFFGEMVSDNDLQRCVAVGDQIGFVYTDDTGRVIIESDSISSEIVSSKRPVLDIIVVSNGQNVIDTIDSVFPLLLVHKDDPSRSGSIEPID